MTLSSTSRPSIVTPQFFGTLPVATPIARALQSMGYTVPTPIQAQAIPILRQGIDVLGQAQTGTGKTAGFGIPLIEALTPERRAVQAIVLVPTRELCSQVSEELTRLGQYRAIRVLAVYGGVGLERQSDALSRGVHVVVGTPGRVEDHLQRGTLSLDQVRLAVLDEADRMLDVGFLPAIERILSRTPAQRQTALFSATMPEEVRSLAHRQMRTPTTISVTPDQPTAELVTQHFETVADGDKLSALITHLNTPDRGVALIFRRTTHKADSLTRHLTKHGFRVAALHGRRTQGQRERVLAQLKAGELQALIATDIAARGLDIAGLTHVFNYDLPDTPETYVHRIGRTGRAGASGIAVTFVAPEDEEALRLLKRYLARLSGGRQEAGSERPRPSRSQKKTEQTPGYRHRHPKGPKVSSRESATDQTSARQHPTEPAPRRSYSGSEGRQPASNSESVTRPQSDHAPRPTEKPAIRSGAAQRPTEQRTHAHHRHRRRTQAAPSYSPQQPVESDNRR